MSTIAVSLDQAKIQLKRGLDLPHHVSILRITLLLLLLHGGSEWELEVPIRVLCGLALVYRPWLTSPLLWIGLSIALIFSNATGWYSIDNHKYLITYWCLVCAISVSAERPSEVVRVNGRLLIGLCFLFATAWKILSGQFGDGSFLHYTFLTDDRLRPYLGFASQLDPRAITANNLLLDCFSASSMDGVAVQLESTSRLKALTLGMSYWTILIEGAVAVAFLWLRPGRLSQARDVLLMIFIVTTYFLLPVLGFAFVLTLMGFAQCEPKRVVTRGLYVALFIAIQFTKAPIGQTIVGWIS